MKALDILRLSYREAKLGKTPLIFGAFLILFYFFVAFSIYYFSYSFLDHFYQYLRDAAPESATVEYSSSDPLNELQTLASFGYEPSDIEMLSGMNYHLRLAQADGTEIGLQYATVNVMTFRGNGPSPVMGRTYTIDDNAADARYIWLDHTIASEYGLSAGDEILLMHGGDTLAVLLLMGTFSAGDLPYDGNAMIPLVAMTDICNGTGLYMPAIVDFQVKESATYFKLKSYLEHKKIDLVSQFEIIYMVIDLIADVFRIFAMFTLLMAVVSFMNYCRIFIHARANSILLYKTLGMPDKNIFFIYYCMTLMLLTVAYLLAFGLHLATKAYFKGIYSGVLGTAVQESGNSILFALFGFSLCILAMTAIFLLNAKKLFFANDVQKLQLEREVI